MFVIHDSKNPFGSFFDILKKSNDEITAVVPNLYDEKFKIKFTSADDRPFPNSNTIIDSLNYQLVGFLPLDVYDDLKGSSVFDIQCVSENVYYILNDYANLYTTVDGGYNWELLKSFKGAVKRIFFLDQQKGWVSIMTDEVVNGVSVSELLYTEDAGKTFQKVDFPDLGEDFITDIYFSGQNSGYILTNKGTIWKKTSDGFKLLYTFPDSRPGNGSQFSNFFVDNNYILAYGQSGYPQSKNVIISGDDLNLSFTTREEEIWQIEKPIAGITFGIFGRKLFSSEDRGQSWIKLSNFDLLSFMFFNSQYGIGKTQVPDISGGEDLLVETRDGGKTWHPMRLLVNNGHPTVSAFSENSAIIGGLSGQMWKYIKY